PEALRMHNLFVESFACLADKKTLPDTGILDKDSWLARPHILVAMQSGANNEIERALSDAGLSRHVVMTLPHWGIANQLVAGTDLILTAARRSFDMTDSNSQVQIFEPPFPIESFDFKLLWHQRREGDAAHNWLRQLITTVLNAELNERT
ncbi:LysR substrate-binding domain-containing protein, partial [Psychrobacter sp.]|uniref:LysR substrate-binding domain-containing protein n=2 Tax=unclassified Psychrobacter TaxID=196806 RepID=UPI000EC7D925